MHALTAALGLVALLVASDTPPFSSFGDWLSKWQTLVGALIALGGAYLTVGKISEQIEQAEKQRQDEIERRRAAARVALPLALASLSQILVRIFKDLDDRFKATQYVIEDPLSGTFKTMASHDPFQVPEIPQETIRVFRDFVETRIEESEISYMGELMASLQILVSRIQNFDFEGEGLPQNLVDRFIDVARVDLLSSQIYNYARFKSGEIPSEILDLGHDEAWEKIGRAASSLTRWNAGSFDFERDALGEIKRRSEAGASPWIERIDG